MASRKSKRYGQGGNNHKHTPNLERPNGKAWKKHPKGFSLQDGHLITTSGNKGKTF